jgi:hypothetical protein
VAGDRGAHLLKLLANILGFFQIYDAVLEDYTDEL